MSNYNMGMFLLWLKLYMLPSSANVVHDQVYRLFEAEFITMSSFESVDRLYSDTRTFALSHKSVEHIAPRGPKSTNPDKKPKYQLAATTVAKYIGAVIHYNRFLGNSHPAELDELCKQLSTRSRNQFESNIISQYLQCNVSANRLNRIDLAVSSDLKVVMTEITTAKNIGSRWANSKIAPLVEICLRLYIMPLPTTMICSMTFCGVLEKAQIDQKKIVACQDLVTNKPKATEIQPLCLLYIDKSDNMLYLAHQLKADHGSGTRLTHHQIPEWLSGIWLVYLRVHKTQVDAPVFHNKFSKLPYKMSKYTKQRLFIPPEWLGLQDARSYGFQTKVLWVIRKCYQHKSNLLSVAAIQNLSKYGIMVGISFATSQSNEFYKGMDSMRSLASALVYFSRELCWGDTNSPSLSHQPKNDNESMRLHTDEYKNYNQFEIRRGSRTKNKPERFRT
jgi:hypothetical protein